MRGWIWLLLLGPLGVGGCAGTEAAARAPETTGPGGLATAEVGPKVADEWPKLAGDASQEEFFATMRGQVVAVQRELFRLSVRAQALDLEDRAEVEAILQVLYSRAAQFEEQLDQTGVVTRQFTPDEIEAGFHRPWERLRQAVRETGDWIARRGA